MCGNANASHRKITFRIPRCVLNCAAFIFCSENKLYNFPLITKKKSEPNISTARALEKTKIYSGFATVNEIEAVAGSCTSVLRTLHQPPRHCVRAQAERYRGCSRNQGGLEVSSILLAQPPKAGLVTLHAGSSLPVVVSSRPTRFL